MKGNNATANPMPETLKGLIERVTYPVRISGRDSDGQIRLQPRQHLSRNRSARHELVGSDELRCCLRQARAD
jgi:hypothetical protein